MSFVNFRNVTIFIIISLLSFTGCYKTDGRYTKNVSYYKDELIEGSLSSRLIHTAEWGNVFVTTFEIDHGRRTYPVEFITDESGNILYDFAWNLTDGKIMSLTVKDMNSDDLDDVTINMGLKGDPTINLELTFYQQINGTFLEGNLIDM